MQRVGLTLALMVLLSACASNRTRIETSWSDPTYSGPSFDRVAVLALFDTEAESRTFEQTAVEMLQQRGVQAVEGHSILQAGELYTQQEMEQELLGADIEGILIFRLIAVDERRVYRRPTPYLRDVPPSVMWGDPFYWYYYPHWNYYWHWRSSLDVTRAPGYWSEYRYVIVETSLYDNSSDHLVWTAKSETMDDIEFDRLAGSVANAITDQLLSLELLDPAESDPAVAGVRPAP